jgi:hypothetical protein
MHTTVRRTEWRFHFNRSWIHTVPSLTKPQLRPDGQSVRLTRDLPADEPIDCRIPLMVPTAT